MKPDDNEIRVRPIEIEDEDGVALPNAGGTTRRRSRRPHRPWMPLAVSGLAVLTLVAIVTWFGAVEFEDAPGVDPELFSLASTPTSTTKPPPTLEEMIPGVTERLTLITTDGDALWTYVWDPTFRVPNEYAMVSPQNPEWLSASFDVGGRYVAVSGFGASSDPYPDVWIGPPTEVDASPDLEDIRSYVWHASDVSRLAYLTSTENGYVLETVHVDVLSKTPSDPIVSLEFSELPDLLAWDNSGFVVQIGADTVALDALGQELWSVTGWARSVSPNYVTVFLDGVRGREWHVVERRTGEHQSFSDFGVDASPELTDVVASPNSDIFAVVTNWESRTAITVVGPAYGTRHISQVDDLVYPYRFTSDSNFLVLRSFDSTDLTFLNWRTGATHVLEVPEDHEALAFNIG